MGFYDYYVTDAKGNQISLKDYEGKVVLVVNTATSFVDLHLSMKNQKNFMKSTMNKVQKILDIPCNQFGGQAPGSDEEIHEFCSLHFNTKFPHMHKSDEMVKMITIYTF